MTRRAPLAVLQCTAADGMDRAAFKGPDIMRSRTILAVFVAAALSACQSPGEQPAQDADPAVAQQAPAATPTNRVEVEFRPVTVEADEGGQRVTRTGLQTGFAAPPGAPEEELRATATEVFDQALRDRTEEVNGTVAVVHFLVGQSVVDGRQRHHMRSYFFLRNDGGWRLAGQPVGSTP